jgi:hypothetical protein
VTVGDKVGVGVSVKVGVGGTQDIVTATWSKVAWARAVVSISPEETDMPVKPVQESGKVLLARLFHVVPSADQ